MDQDQRRQISDGSGIAGGSQPLVLLVDDEPHSLKLLAQALAEQPLALAMALDGETALRLSERETPELILLDARMPGMDGFEVFSKLRQNPATRNIPIIFITSLNDTTNRVSGLELGAVDYITKPFVPAELAARVRTQVAIRMSARTLAQKNAELEQATAELSQIRDTLEAEVTRRTNEAIETNHQLSHLQRVVAINGLAASITHELNQPLQAIMSNAQAARRLLAKHPPATAQGIEALEDIVASARQANELIQRMRSMYANKAPGKPELLDLSDFISETVRLIDNEFMLRRTTLRIEISSSLPQMRGDRVQLGQVLLNLLLNAIDAVSEQPEDERWIVVRAHGDGERVCFSVEDSGQGLSPEQLDRIFEAFYTTKPNGLGVGLAISRSIVEAHRGHIWAENTAEGTNVLCTFPAVSGSVA